MPDPATPDLRALRIGALLNTSSGSCDAGAEHELEAILEETGCRAVKVWCGGGEAVGAALGEVGSHDLDVLIVLGGDGTIRSAAESCSAEGPYLVPLPGGTMNMLPKALYGERSWQDALRATLTAPEVQRVNGGRIGQDQFFVVATIGNPSLWAEAREAVREGEIGKAVEQGVDALKKAFGNSLRYSFDGQSGEAEAVSILCPLTSRAMEDDETALEVAVITPQGAVDAFKLALRTLFSEWRNDPNVVTAKARRVELASDEPIPAILDGETVELGATAVVAFVPTAFKALVPREGATG